METMRESWTDDRLDDLNSKVDDLRVEMKEEFASVRREMREGFDRVDDRFQAMDERLFATHRMMMGFCGLMFTALIGLIATFVTQV